jgi:hypothetical protein
VCHLPALEYGFGIFRTHQCHEHATRELEESLFVI